MELGLGRIKAVHFDKTPQDEHGSRSTVLLGLGVKQNLNRQMVSMFGEQIVFNRFQSFHGFNW